MKLDRIQEWPFPKDLNSIEEINTHLKKLYLALEEDSVLRLEELDITTEGEYNTMLGVNAGYSITTGTRNTLIGINAGYSITTGSSNLALGDQALYSNTDGLSNVALGKNALFTSSSDDNNIAVGDSALRYTDGGTSNVAIGTAALCWNTTGASGVAVGHNALIYNTSGINNVALGAHAGLECETGRNNVFLGKSAGGQETGSYKLYIATTNTTTPLIYGEFDNGILIFNANYARIEGDLTLKEITTPTAIANYGKIYTKADNKIYFQDGAGVEHTVAYDVST